MSWPASVVVDAIFIPIYVVLSIMSIFNVFKHGHGKKIGFIYLVIFSIIRLVGNVLLVIAYHNHYNDPSVTEWGFICQGLGYTFFINATLSFYARARDPSSSQGVGGIFKNPSPTKILHLVSMIGLILLITGYGDINFGNGIQDISNAKLDTKAKVGDVLFLFCTIAIAILTIFSLSSTSPTLESKRIYQFILLALPFMFIRMVYVTFESFTSHPFNRKLWENIAFEYVQEVVVVVVYFILGFVTQKVENTTQEIEDGDGKKRSECYLGYILSTASVAWKRPTRFDFNVERQPKLHLDLYHHLPATLLYTRLSAILFDFLHRFASSATSWLVLATLIAAPLAPRENAPATIAPAATVPRRPIAPSALVQDLVKVAIVNQRLANAKRCPHEMLI